MTYSTSDGRTAHTAGAFDIRTFIAILIGIYGVVLVVMGLFATTDEELAQADGLNINLWAGIGMVLVAAGFQVWAMLRPVAVPDVPDTDEHRNEATGPDDPAG